MAYSVNNSLSNFTKSDAIQKADVSFAAEETANTTKANTEVKTPTKINLKETDSNYSVSELFDDDEENSDYTPLRTSRSKEDIADSLLSEIASSSSDSHITLPSDSVDVKTSYFALAAAVGASNKGVTKEQLEGYLQFLLDDQQDFDLSTIRYVRTLINNFDSLSNDTGYMTVSSLVCVADEPQTPEAISSEQLESPINIKV